GYPRVIPSSVTRTITTGVIARNTTIVYPITSRAPSLNSPRIGSIQNGCTRLASASPRSYAETTQPRCVFSVWAASITYGASITHFDPPDGTNTPSAAE